MIKTTEIQSVNSLNNTASYLQTKYRKWFKYIDKAWELVNFFQNEKDSLPFSMNLDKLEMKDDKCDSKVRVWVDSFWMNFDSPWTINYCLDRYKKNLEYISNLLELDDFYTVSRRQQYVYQIPKWVNLLFEDLMGIEWVKWMSFSWRYKEDDWINVHYTVKKINMLDSDWKPEEEESLLIDIDILNKDAEKPYRGLQKIMNYHKWHKMLKFINKIIWAI